MDSLEKIKPKLFLLGVSLGNPKDISPRVVEILSQADLIIGEEARTTSTLLKKLGISKQFELFNEHSTKEDLQDLVARITTLPVSCLMSDAGMPVIEDPGLNLVERLREFQIEITCVPGPTALTTALALSGFSVSPFTFLGFLPREKIDRKKVLSTYLKLKHTLVLYETPYRYKDVIKDIAELSPKSRLFIGLGLTTETESQLLGEAKDLAKKTDSMPKSPPVIVISPAS